MEQKTLEETETNKPTTGTWDKIGEEDKNKINFEINIPQVVVFAEESPEEMQSQTPGEVYYKFNVQDGKHFFTGAWTMLGALKKLVPIKGKKVSIVKKLVKGRQVYEVLEVINGQENS